VTIERDSADPPFRQLAVILRSQIERGEITTRLPGEKTLQQEYGLALATVRKAVKVLRDEGLVRTVPGWGTYVIPPDQRPKRS
jgi:GntR family transcriptional regulator